MTIIPKEDFIKSGYKTIYEVQIFNCPFIFLAID